MPRLARLRPLILLVGAIPLAVQALRCDGTCNGHGACDITTGRCACFPGFVGVTCASYACPEGIAWTDYASADDTAHALAECSNMGNCDRTTGVCKCASGFEGAACERMSCPTCANGRCVSMREAAQLHDDTNFFVSTTYSLWDADKIYGCQCDPGFFGWDCSLRACPKGDDPMTVGQVDEIQQLNCLCDGCTGSFALTFRRRTTVNLLPTDTPATLKAALEALDTIFGVTVSLSGTGTTICDTDGATTSITFTHNPGNLPDLQIQNRLVAGATGTAHLTLSSSGATGEYDGVTSSQDGTREELYCSNRGVCDFGIGVCICAAGFSSSNGAGQAGTLGDCGYGTTAACPTTSSGVCDGHGICSGATTWTCSCYTGYGGADCSQRQCPTGEAWFDGATAPDTAHALAPCSNKGTCDSKTGLCTCNSLFTGAACELLKCPGSSTACNGHGTCKTMAQLAMASAENGVALGVTYGATLNTAATWDANKLQGCDCSRGYYLGPYAGAFGDFHEYDCTSRYCPLGADPYEKNKVNEIQTIECQADGGTFTLTFRDVATKPIAFDATKATLQARLEALTTITSVLVTIGSGTAVCDGAAAIASTIEFQWEQGDLPLLSVDASKLTLTSGTPTLTVTKTQTGTKANTECSARGVCDRTTGVCDCFDTFLSSDGDGNYGKRGDCGYIARYA